LSSLCLFLSNRSDFNSSCRLLLSEQLIPMFGLVALEHTVHPSTTLEKLAFLFENAFAHYNGTTTIISFGALLILVFLRVAKNRFRTRWWIYRVPEVLVVVVVSTCACSFSSPCMYYKYVHPCQFFRMNYDGTKKVSISWDPSRSTLENRSFNLHSVIPPSSTSDEPRLRLRE